MTETQLKVKVQKYLKSIGAFYFKHSDRFSAGVPDLSVVYNGRTIWIELKTNIGRVSKMQKFYIDAINNAGGEAYVCRSLDEVKDIIRAERSARHTESRVPSSIRRVVPRDSTSTEEERGTLEAIVCGG